MSHREVLIMLAHALDCGACRERLLREPAKVFSGRPLTADEKDALTHLTSQDFVTEMVLARKAGTTVEELHGYRDHPVSRLRHF
jgi:hypothetical protein